MATKMATACWFELVDTLSHLSPDFLVISYIDYLNQTGTSSNMGFVRRTMIKMADKMVAAC